VQLTPDEFIPITLSVAVIATFIYFSFFVFPFREISEETRRRQRSFISNALFREYWYFIMTPMKNKLIEWDVHPNTLTIWGVILSIVAGVAFGLGSFGVGGWLVVLAATCDVYDGMLARARAISLKSGAFFDSTLDRIGELGMFFGVLWHFRFDDVWMPIVFILIASGQVVSYARARAEGLGFDGGKAFFQRAERMIVLALGMGLVPFVGLVFGDEGRDIMIKITTSFIALGSMQTAVTRTYSIYRDIRKTEKA